VSISSAKILSACRTRLVRSTSSSASLSIGLSASRKASAAEPCQQDSDAERAPRSAPPIRCSPDTRPPSQVAVARQDAGSDLTSVFSSPAIVSHHQHDGDRHRLGCR
jgi:hypothetical protein